MARLRFMKDRWFYIFGVILFGMLAFSPTGAKNHVPVSCRYSSVIVKSSPLNSNKQPTGDSPFIRFHHGIDENGVSISTPGELVVFLKPVNSIPEKFAGIFEYLSARLYRIPAKREFLYSLPLRSPPFFC